MDRRYFHLLKESRGSIRGERGQGTVEAAFCIPIVFLLFLMLIQPAVILYDRMVMEAAAAEGCRLLATLPSGSSDLFEDYVLRHLGSIPPQEFFHKHEHGCSWDVKASGSATDENVSVTISTKLRPIPLVAIGMSFAGLTDSQGYFTLTVTREAEPQPEWVRKSNAGDPSEWVGAWYED